VTLCGGGGLQCIPAGQFPPPEYCVYSAVQTWELPRCVTSMGYEAAAMLFGHSYDEGGGGLQWSHAASIIAVHVPFD
jgi:hypothetical protein